MKLLLDTHVLLWLFLDDPRLSRRQLSAIAEASTVSVSAISVAEISIKTSLGKLHAPADLREQLVSYGFLEAPFRADHAWRMRQLPRLHGDPFDRMLIAQALTDALTLVTDDAAIKQYDVAQL